MDRTLAERTSSTDPTLVGRKGIVVNETRNTIALLEGAQRTVLNKTSIAFTVDNSAVVIQEAMVGQRPEDRSTEHTGRHDTMAQHRDIGIDVKAPPVSGMGT